MDREGRWVIETRRAPASPGLIGVDEDEADREPRGLGLAGEAAAWRATNCGLIIAVAAAALRPLLVSLMLGSAGGDVDC